MVEFKDFRENLENYGKFGKIVGKEIMEREISDGKYVQEIDFKKLEGKLWRLEIWKMFKFW